MLGLHLIWSVALATDTRQDNGVTSRTRSALHTLGYAGPTLVHALVWDVYD